MENTQPISLDEMYKLGYEEFSKPKSFHREPANIARYESFNDLQKEFYQEGWQDAFINQNRP